MANRYQVDDNGDFEWVFDTQTGLAVDPSKICELLNRTSATEGGSTHQDDKAVDEFAVAMKEKLAQKRAEGRGGWEDKAKCSNAALSEMLVSHVAKGDPVDVANFAMMLHARGERILRWIPITEYTEDVGQVDLWLGNAEFPRRETDCSFRQFTESEWSTHHDVDTHGPDDAKHWFDDGLRDYPFVGDEFPTHFMLRPKPPTRSA